ncbi:MAG: glycosyltransferase family 2 protein [Bacteroidales bacterium]|nr:glycosyltransferase family 2 protein [Bacteroidales bacterium]
MIELSLVIPLFNEADLVHELVRRSVAALAEITPDFEILFVDDGSRDETLSRLLDIRQTEPRIKVIELSRNFGHQAAFTAGLTFASGNYIAMMDGDLQDPPEVIGEMYRKLTSGNIDVVYGKRTNKTGTIQGKWSKFLFHKTFKRISGFPDIENVGNFSLLNRPALESLLKFSESTRYLPGLRRFIGFRQEHVEYTRDERYSGKSKMRFSDLLSLSSDAIFSFSRLPVRLCLFLGLTGIVVFFLAGLYTLIAKIAGFAIIGWSSTLLSIYFLGSIQLTFLGILGEYVFRIYRESQRRPLFLVKQFYV